MAPSDDGIIALMVFILQHLLHDSYKKMHQSSKTGAEVSGEREWYCFFWENPI